MLRSTTIYTLTYIANWTSTHTHVYIPSTHKHTQSVHIQPYYLDCILYMRTLHLNYVLRVNNEVITIIFISMLILSVILTSA